MKETPEIFLFGWLYFISGLTISILIENFIFDNVTPKNSSDFKLIYSSIVRISFLIFGFSIVIQLLDHRENCYLLIGGSLIQITNLYSNVRYLVDKYISKSVNYPENKK